MELLKNFLKAFTQSFNQPIWIQKNNLIKSPFQSKLTLIKDHSLTRGQRLTPYNDIQNG